MFSNLFLQTKMRYIIEHNQIFSCFQAKTGTKHQTSSKPARHQILYQAGYLKSTKSTAEVWNRIEDPGHKLRSHSLKRMENLPYFWKKEIVQTLSCRNLTLLTFTRIITRTASETVGTSYHLGTESKFSSGVSNQTSLLHNASHTNISIFQIMHGLGVARFINEEISVTVAGSDAMFVGLKI